MASVDVRVSVQGVATDRTSWLQLARDVEAADFHALYTADHPGSAAAPFVALAAAAAVTERIALGTCVVNAGVWEPLALANEVATLDVVSGGRAILGIGAGHTPQEWTASGRAFPSAGARVGRMIELARTTQTLLHADGPTSFDGRFVSLVDAALDAPRPVQERVPLLVGGNGDRVLRFAARHADIVGISGLGRTLADGHRHDVDWSPDAIRRTLDAVSAQSRAATRTPEIEALVQFVEIGDPAASIGERVAPHISGATVEDLVQSPFVWIGRLDEIVAKLRRFAKLGVGNYVVRAPARGDAQRIVAALK
jgi:probable F420-dependent oxidoreductase